MKAQAYPASLREAEPGSATEASDDEPRVVDHIDLNAKHAIEEVPEARMYYSLEMGCVDLKESL